jgi:hypothetical protein
LRLTGGRNCRVVGDTRWTTTRCWVIRCQNKGMLS